MKGDVVLETHQGPGSGDGGLIEDLIAFVDGDKTRALGTLLAGDDSPGAIGLSGEGLVVPRRMLLGVGPHRSPRARMGVRVPHRLTTTADVALAPGAPLGGDGVNELAVSEGVLVPVEVRLQIPWGADLSGADDEPHPGVVQGRQVGGREHAGISDDHELLNAVSGSEGVHDGDDCGGLGLVPLPAADLERDTMTVDQQAHDDLGGDPPLLGVPTLRRSSSRSASK